MKKKQVIWNEDTVDHFKFEANYQKPEDVFVAIKEFIEIDVVPEDGESEESLALDLFFTVYNN